jgi:hypothetical protein
MRPTLTRQNNFEFKTGLGAFDLISVLIIRRWKSRYWSDTRSLTLVMRHPLLLLCYRSCCAAVDHGIERVTTRAALHKMEREASYELRCL